MRSFNNCTSPIIFIVILVSVWSLDRPNVAARVLYNHGVNRSPSDSDGVDKGDKTANYIKKGCPNESSKREKSIKDYENPEDFSYESSPKSWSLTKEIQHSKARSIIENKRSQANQIIPMVATSGGSLFVLVVVLMFCSKKAEDQEEIHDQHDERIQLTQSPSGKFEIPEGNDLGKGGSSFRTPSIKQDNTNTQNNTTTPDNQNVQEDSKDSNDKRPITAPVVTPPPPPPRGSGAPPPPTVKRPPAPPLKGGGRGPPPPPGPGNPGKRFGNASGGNAEDANRTKLKPFFWDKVQASAEQSMVWDEIRAGSFQFNEDMIESLFGYNPDEKKLNDRRGKKPDSGSNVIHIIDSKKAQNLSILLKALNVTTEEVCDALLEGQELPAELLQTLIRMAPTSEEELKLRLFSGDLSLIGPSERFLKVVVDIPFAFRRMECLLFMMSLKEEVSGLKESFDTLEVASNTLKSSRLFLKILEAVLKTGNRMNAGTYRGSAQAFKIDTLLKLSDVKGIDGKTNLLHFVVQEIIRTEGIKAARVAIEKYSTSSDDIESNPMENCRALGLQVVSSLSTELEVIKKAAIIDSDSLTSTAARLGQSLLKTKDFLNREMQDLGEESRFYHALKDFVDVSENKITWLLGEERRIMELVKKTVDYFQGTSTREEGLRLFVVVRDFLVVFDKICAEIKKKMDQEAKTVNKDKSSTRTSPQDSRGNRRTSTDRDSSSDNEVSSKSQTSSTKENSMKEKNINDGPATSSTKEEPIKEDNKIPPILRGSSSKGKSVKEDNEVSSLLRTSFAKEKSVTSGNEALSLSRTSSANGKSIMADDHVSPMSRASYAKEKLMLGGMSKSQSSSPKEKPNSLQTSPTKESTAKDDDGELEDKPTKQVFDENQTESSSQESSSIDEKKKKVVTQETVIADMRQKLFPAFQDSFSDESNSSSDDDDESQTYSKGSLKKVHSSQESQMSSRTSNSSDNKQMKQVPSHEKVKDDRQQKLFQGIQNRRLDDSSSDGFSSGDES